MPIKEEKNSLSKIIHIDMDAFYAAIEQRDHPLYRGKPVVVGGHPQFRGVVSTCSYEARKYGIHSAMPTRTAFRLCPKAIFVKPRMEIYAEVSKQIKAIFFEFTDLVEPLSLDEAYLDVTQNKKREPSAILLAEALKRRLFEKTGLTASAGVAAGKFFAKLASDMNKPNGLTVIRPQEAEGFIEALPIRKFFGIGEKTEEHLKRQAIFFGRDLKIKTREEMKSLFGKSGDFYFNIVRGIDLREVKAHRMRKSIGAEKTFAQDIAEVEIMKERLSSICQEMVSRMKRAGVEGRTLTLKIKFHDFKTITRSLSSSDPYHRLENIYELACDLLTKEKIGNRQVRLLGLSMSNLTGHPRLTKDKKRELQLSLLEDV